jgi:hypothetical protein
MKIIEIIRNREKAKLAILKELQIRNMDRFELADEVSRKYYDRDFRVLPFMEILESQGLIKMRENKYELADKMACSEALAANKKETALILSLDYGKGDFTCQLGEQEKYVFYKILSFGNSIAPSKLYDAIYDDVDRGIGPFHGYARSNYGKKKAQEVTMNLMKKRFLKADGSISIPERVLSDFLTENSTELVSMLKETNEKVKGLAKRNDELSSNIDQLKTDISKFDPTSALQVLRVSESIRNRIDKAVRRIDERSFSEAIINCYLVSETLVNLLFDFLYSDSKIVQRIKHEDKLKKIWNDEENEKRNFPGISVIASLLYVVLWYRNKMAAHTEMPPTREAARISVTSLIQALIEFERLGIKIDA